MPRYLLDIDHLTLYEQGHGPLGMRLAAEPPGSVALSAVTVQEALQGRLAAVARARDGAGRIKCYGRLVGTAQTLAQFPIVAFDAAAEQKYQDLRALKLGIGTHDLLIGAVALVNQLVVITRNKSDFSRIPGLALDDWSV